MTAMELALKNIVCHSVLSKNIVCHSIILMLWTVKTNILLLGRLALSYPLFSPDPLCIMHIQLKFSGSNAAKYFHARP